MTNEPNQPVYGEQFERFFSTIYEPGDFFEVRMLPAEQGGGSRTVSVGRRYENNFNYDDLERLIAPHHNSRWQGVYVGVNPHRSLRGTGYQGQGRDDDVVLARCLFVDFDDATPAEAMSRINNGPLPPPTLLISSGRATGTHAYWRLVQPVTDMDVWRGLQRTLIRMLNSDRSIINPSRIMRLPGTFNFTRGEMCRILLTDAVYADWEALGIRPEVVLHDQYNAPPPNSPPDWQNFNNTTTAYLTIERIPEGGRGTIFSGRNTALFAAAMDFKANRIPIEDAIRELVDTRAVNRDGMNRTEALRTVANAYRRQATPTFSRVVCDEPLTSLAARLSGFAERPETSTAPPILDAQQVFSLADTVNNGGDNAPGTTVPVSAEDRIGAVNIATAVADDIATRHAQELPSPVAPLNTVESVRADGRPVAASDRPHVSNVDTRRMLENGREKVVLLFKPVDHIAREMVESLGGWPKRARSTGLFMTKETKRGQVEVWPLLSQSQLFAAIHDRATCRWIQGECESELRDARSAVTKQEFFEWMKDNAEPSYDTVTSMPHVPERPGVYYMPCPLPQPTGEALRTFLQALNPATELDRTLMLAAMLTPGWGGPPGARPVFVFSSDYGQGSGKTQTVKAISSIWGGAVALDYEEDWGTITKRITSSDDWLSRCFLFDNVRGRFNSPAIEAAVTSDRISGHKMYVGTVSRPNDATFFITFNTPEMSRDLAQRAVIIKMGQPRTTDFVEWSSTFIVENRWQLMADLLDILRRPTAQNLASENRDRWQAWQQGVLAKITGHDVNVTAREIIQRRPAADAEADESTSMVFEISRHLRRTGRDDVGGRSVTTSAEIFRVLVAANAWVPPEGISARAQQTRCAAYVRSRLAGRGVLVATDTKVSVGEDGAPSPTPTGSRSAAYHWVWEAVRGVVDSDTWEEIEAVRRPAGGQMTLTHLPV